MRSPLLYPQLYRRSTDDEIFFLSGVYIFHDQGYDSLE